MIRFALISLWMGTCGTTASGLGSLRFKSVPLGMVWLCANGSWAPGDECLDSSRNRTIVLTHGWLPEVPIIELSFPDNALFGEELNPAIWASWLEHGWNLGVFSWAEHAIQGSRVEDMAGRSEIPSYFPWDTEQAVVDKNIPATMCRHVREALVDTNGTLVLAGQSMGALVVALAIHCLSDLPHPLVLRRVVSLDPYTILSSRRVKQCFREHVRSSPAAVLETYISTFIGDTSHALVSSQANTEVNYHTLTVHLVPSAFVGLTTPIRSHVYATEWFLHSMSTPPQVGPRGQITPSAATPVSSLRSMVEQRHTDKDSRTWVQTAGLCTRGLLDDRFALVPLVEAAVRSWVVPIDFQCFHQSWFL
jgi:hypothetical protein